MTELSVEEQLRISEERYRFFVERTAEGFYRLESKVPIRADLPVTEQVDLMYKHMYVADCNDFIARMYGHQHASEHIGQYFARYHESGEIEGNRIAMEKFIENGYRLVDVETLETDAQGELRHILNDCVGIVENGYVVSIWGTARDVTARRHIEQENRDLERKMLQTQKLESLGLLAGNIAHDFNNLLTTILGGVGVAKLDLQSPAKLILHLDMIQRSAQRAAGFCRQLQAYAGGASHIAKPSDLSDLVEEIVSLLKISVPKHIEIRCELGRDLPTVIADRNQLQQVVLNLITNAWEAIGDKNSGCVEVSTSVADSGASVYMQVRDNGCGIDENNLTKLYEPFFSTKGEHEGRGLGLSAVQGIMKAHGGSIDVTTTPGEGSTFRLTFPASESPAEIQSEPETKDDWRGGGLALIVDDEEDIRELTRVFLERVGFRVRTAANGLEAQEIFLQQPDDFKLALLDVSMPKMDGSELFRLLRSVRPDVPIVMSSGFDQNRACAQIAPDDRNTTFLQKPFMVSDLLRKIQEAHAS